MLYYIENSKTFSAHGRLDLLDEVCAFKSPATRRAGAMPQSVEALQLPGNPEAIEYPEVELGIQDRFPSEVSESPGKDADDDKAGATIHRICQSDGGDTAGNTPWCPSLATVTLLAVGLATRRPRFVAFIYSIDNAVRSVLVQQLERATVVQVHQHTLPP